MVKDAKRVLLVAVTGTLVACATNGGGELRMATNKEYCPVGTVMVCSGLYEPERELAPSCGCASLMGRR